jgi:hypothetical protein
MGDTARRVKGSRTTFRAAASEPAAPALLHFNSASGNFCSRPLTRRSVPPKGFRGCCQKKEAALLQQKREPPHRYSGRGSEHQGERPLNTDQNLPEPPHGWRGHDFWPSVSVLEAIPALYATEDTPEREKVVHLHYFVGGCDWWVVELDSAERPQLAFGYVCLGDPQMAEWGYIPLDELTEVFRSPAAHHRA